MPSKRISAMVGGIVGLILGAGAMSLGLIFHYHPVIADSVGGILLALGGAGVGYSYAMWPKRSHFQTQVGQHSAFQERVPMVDRRGSSEAGFP